MIMSSRTSTQRTYPTTTTPTPAHTPPSIHSPTITHINLAAETIPITNNNYTSYDTAVTQIFHNAVHTHAQRISWRLRQYFTQVITANNRLKRRRRKKSADNNNNNNSNNNGNSNNCSHITDSSSGNCNQCNNNNNNNNIANTFTMLPNSAVKNYGENNNNQLNNNCENYSNKNNNNNNLSKTTTTSPAIQLSNAATQALKCSKTAILCIAALFILTTCCSFCAASPCDLNSWWDPLKDKCILCTVCEGELIPLRPCQLHRDTICGSIYDLKIDWVVLAKTEPNWKERRKEDVDIELEQQLSHEELQQLQDGTLPMDWQTTALFMAVLACLVFFVIAAGILVHHMRQWRRMERRLDQDVEELSTKLMAKLAEVQSMDGGTFFIGNADALGVSTNFQPHHVLLPEKPAKHHERRILKTLQPGNVYIEENGSKG